MDKPQTTKPLSFNQRLAENYALKNGEVIWASVAISARKRCTGASLDIVTLVPGTYAEKNGEMLVFAKVDSK